MYGTIFRMKVKPEMQSKVIDLFNQWDREHKSRATGAVGGLLLKPDRESDELVGVAVFQDQATYRANAEHPEQDRWYRELRGCLLEDPQWEDGEYVAGALGQ